MLDLDYLTDCLQQELSSFGFPDDMKIHFSLSYCQGDGVSFEGTLKKDNLLRIIDGIEEYTNNASKKEKLIKLINKIDWNDDNENYEDLCFFGRNQIKQGYSHIYDYGEAFDLDEYRYIAWNYQDWSDPNEISITQSQFCRYYHWNSMVMDCCSADQIWYFDESMKDRWFFKPESLQEYKDLWNEFTILLDNHIKSISMRLEQLGYEIIEDFEDYEEMA